MVSDISDVNSLHLAQTVYICRSNVGPALIILHTNEQTMDCSAGHSRILREGKLSGEMFLEEFRGFVRGKFSNG